MNEKLVMGVIGTSNKENEFRIPIHPKHMEKIPKQLRERIYFEDDYAKKFHMSKEKLNELFAGTLRRNELFVKCDIILLAKPTDADFPSFREGLASLCSGRIYHPGWN